MRRIFEKYSLPVTREKGRKEKVVILFFLDTLIGEYYHCLRRGEKMGKAERTDEYSCFPRELRLKGIFLCVCLLFFSFLPLQGDEKERRENLSLNALLGEMMERTPTWSSDLTPWEWLLNLSSPLGTDKSRILALSKISDA